MDGYMIVGNDYSQDINGNIIKYEIGKTYDRDSIDADIQHILRPPNSVKVVVHFAFYDTLLNLFRYQEFSLDNKILVIEGENIEIVYGTFYKANKIKVIRELDKDEIKTSIYTLDFVQSGYSELRRIAALHGCGLVKLIYDKDQYVRSAVAEYGYGLDILVKDDSSIVRTSIAYIGKKLDILINDESDMVRYVVAMQGYKLDKLVNDKNITVRTAVAMQGYALDRLLMDENVFVRKAAEEHITYYT